MSGEVSKVIDPKELWSGGRSPFSLSYGKMMMWFFLISDALTFGAFLVSLGWFRYTSDAWPISDQVFFHIPFVHSATPDEGFPLLYVAFMTFILIVSSVTMVLAVEAGHRNDKKTVIKWMVLTVIGGLIFLGSQVWEWSGVIAGPDGLFGTYDDTRIGGNYLGGWEMVNNVLVPIVGPDQYAQFFYCVTGFHGLHVFSGVIINIVILINVIGGTYERRGHYEMVEKGGLYWHFVDLVWVFVFTFFYLL
jgi:cytochrome c oxidase subunit 3